MHRVRQWDEPAGSWIDLSCDAMEVTIRHGRSGPDEQPEPGAATVDLYSGVPAKLDVGTQIQVQTQLSTAAWVTRFYGYVTDLSMEFGLGTDQPTGTVQVVPFTRMTCVDAMANLGRRFVGDTPWPQELDGPRANRILGLGGLSGAVVDPGTVQVIPRDVDRQPALDLIQDLATQAGGLFLVSKASAQAIYQDAEHRRNAVAALTLDACQLVMSPQWTRDTQGLVNEVALGYGVPAGGGDQSVYTATSADSQARYGRIAYSLGTQLATLADATTRANALLTRNAYPVWDVQAIEVVLSELDATAYDYLMQTVEVGELLGLTGMPVEAPNAYMALWIEGWEEHLTLDTHELVLQVSGYCRTAPFVRWDDADPSIDWNELASTLRWDDSWCLGPLPSYGRWIDVPGNLQWGNVATTITWDTWPY